VKGHYLKIEGEYLDLIISGDKTFEISKNDRGYETGDLVALARIDGKDLVMARILHVTKFKQRWGYVVFSLGNVEHVEHVEHVETCDIKQFRDSFKKAFSL